MLKLNEIQKFEIELTNYCNAKCPGCMRTTNPSIPLNTNHLPFEKIKKLTEQLPHSKSIVVYFGGSISEPLMNPEIYEIVEYCASRYHRIVIDTNASLGTKEFWTKLGKLSSESNRIVINFSIDGLEDTNHIYRVNTDFKKIISNLNTYIQNGGYAIWKFLIFEHNKHQVEEAQSFAKEIGCKNFIHMETGRGPKNMIAQTQMKDRFNEVGKILAETEINCKTKEKNFLYITNDFKLIPCCHLRGFPDVDSAVDLDVVSLEDALQDKKYAELEKTWNTPECNFACKRACGTKRQWSRKEYTYEW